MWIFILGRYRIFRLVYYEELNFGGIFKGVIEVGWIFYAFIVIRGSEFSIYQKILLHGPVPLIQGSLVYKEMNVYLFCI